MHTHDHRTCNPFSCPAAWERAYGRLPVVVPNEDRRA